MNSSFFLIPSPVQAIEDDFLLEKKIKLFIKREDLIHPEVSGNKYRKLKYNLLEAKRLSCDTLLTFGGAFSNHIYAVAAAGKYFGFKTIGIIRGEKHEPLNASTLIFAESCGMELFYVSREKYKEKEILADFNKKNIYVIPEGGTNALAIKGVAEMLDESFDAIRPNFVACAIGTGGTAAGILESLKGKSAKLLGFSALKNGSFLKELIHEMVNYDEEQFILNTDYHFGGYAKTKPALIDFIRKFELEHPQILLEQVYTGKMLFGIYDRITQNMFPENSTILAIHTGGLQGRRLV
ncbi:MAG: 1-aminocyclopropane-1-carboxylate deaminase/D-cysteine desulfhydrase [Pseudarcicella sp.]|nr:1-aminocyclopropane-1-carboxylate deaminase/D-cysteine desulfhydrase [Pseudarcicella sp.]